MLTDVIYNNVRKGLDAYNVQNTKGILNITAANGLDIQEIVQDDVPQNAIFAGGAVNINISGGEGNIAGKITDKGNLTITNSGTETLNISGEITAPAGNVVIDSNAQTNLAGNITANRGDIEITAKGLTLNENAEILDKKGDISVTNSAGALNLGGDIAAQDGNVTITSSGADGAEIDGAVSASGGNIEINNAAGALTFAATSAVTNQNAGDVTIAHTGDGALNLGGALATTAGNIDIDSTAQTNLAGNITAGSGNIEITSAGLQQAADTEITTGEGDISVTNSAGELNLGGALATQDGNVTIVNSGVDGAEISGAITNANGNISIENQKADLRFAEGSALQNTAAGDIIINNTDEASALIIAADIGVANAGNVTINNTGSDKLELAESGKIRVTKGDLKLTNANAGALEIAGSATTLRGNSTFANTSEDGMKIATTGQIINERQDITLDNSGAGGLTVEGQVTALRQSIVINNRDSDLVIGEYESANDNYITAQSGNIVINQTNGDVLNGIVDPTGDKHQNADLGNPAQSYKTLITADGNLMFNVTDGNIGYTDAENAGFSVEAPTRDWTDSINVNVGGNVTASAVNDTKSDARLINLRAKDSDLNIKSIKADGNVMLTAADWKLADVRPTPEEEAYFRGYSVSNMAKADSTAVFGRNISIIASNSIGGANKKMTYIQDTLANPQSAISFEAENNIYASGDANSDTDVKINQMIAKRGTIAIDLNKDAVINKITAGKGLEITQKAQNLTILDLGTSSEAGEGELFEDMLNPHDDLVYGEDSEDSSKNTVPQYVILRVLDAADTAERGDSNLKVYSMAVRGNNGENADYYSTGGRLADVTLMADNIYVNSDKAPDSSIPTKENPAGYKQTQTSYRPSDFGFDDDTEHQAKGINAYGEGDALSIDVLGVDEKTVNALVQNPQRGRYNVQETDSDSPSKFRSGASSVYNSRTQNAVISVNDYATEERGVVFDALYADNAYVNTLDTNLQIQDGYINDYAEIRNGNRAADASRHTVIIDNDYRRLLPANVQLYTAQTGNFGLTMSEKIKLDTPAPVTHYEWDKLVHAFNDENSFVRIGLKETEIRQKAKDYYMLDNVYALPQNLEPNYEVWKDNGLASNVKIIEISRIGATIVNYYNWQIGEEHELELAFDDIRTKLKCVVTGINRSLATVKFTDMPASVANKLTYRYMKTAAN